VSGGRAARRALL